MKAYIHLLEYIIDMWDPDQQHFVVGTHTLTIDIDDTYFMNGLSQKERQVVLSGSRGSDSTLDDLIDRYCSIGTHAQARKLPIK